MKLAKTAKKSDVAAACLIASLCVYVIVSARHFPERAGLFPTVIASITLTLSLVIAVVNFFKLASQRGMERGGDKPSVYVTRFWITGLLIVGYMIGMLIIGYITSTILYLSFSFWTYGYRNKLVSTILVVCMTAVVYAVFEMALDIKLPVGLLLGGVMY
ncbi:MAG: tripartite tricarboxylate transporter TctB family protein [Synergistaceae bacterium]|jgi:hypothetical protein|nr:tripartite tricarboxylate transporter TctB family protein [Synergistaceae bacterium]